MQVPTIVSRLQSLDGRKLDVHRDGGRREERPPASVPTKKRSETVTTVSETKKVRMAQKPHGGAAASATASTKVSAKDRSRRAEPESDNDDDDVVDLVCAPPGSGVTVAAAAAPAPSVPASKMGSGVRGVREYERAGKPTSSAPPAAKHVAPSASRRPASLDDLLALASSDPIGTGASHW